MKTPKITESLCDMHYGIKDEFYDYEKRLWRVVPDSWHIMRLSNSSKLVEEMFFEDGIQFKYHNKFLVILDYDEQTKQAKAVYAIDGVRLGIMKLNLVS